MDYIVGLNVLALIVVAYQTYLNRQSLKAAQKSIEEYQKVRQLELLPRAYYIVEVRYFLKKWRDELNNISQELEMALSARDQNVLKELSNKGLESPMGLVSKHSYEHAPKWLSMLWVAGAQYYYECKCNMPYLWRKKDIDPDFSQAEMLIPLCKGHAIRITQLLTFISDVVPESFLECPAKLSDEHFLD